MRISIGAALFCLFLSAPARAHEVEVGTAIVCDTQQQVERFVSFMRGSARSAVSAVCAVNAEEHDKSACGMSKLAFMRGASLSVARTKEETFEIVEILVVGVAAEEGGQQTIPAVYFAVFKGDEERAQPVFCSFFRASSQGHWPGISV
jgi:hypothetical protein